MEDIVQGIINTKLKLDNDKEELLVIRERITTEERDALKGRVKVDEVRDMLSRLIEFTNYIIEEHIMSYQIGMKYDQRDEIKIGQRLLSQSLIGEVMSKHPEEPGYGLEYIGGDRCLLFLKEEKPGGMLFIIPGEEARTLSQWWKDWKAGHLSRLDDCHLVGGELQLTTENGFHFYGDRCWSSLAEVHYFEWCQK